MKTPRILLLALGIAWFLAVLFLPVSELCEYSVMHPEDRTCEGRTFFSHFGHPPAFSLPFLLYALFPALVFLQAFFIRRPFRWYAVVLVLLQVCLIGGLTVLFHFMMSFDLHDIVHFGYAPERTRHEAHAAPAGWITMGINAAIALWLVFILIRPKSAPARLFSTR
jgi:hypothetical protein